MRRRTIGSILLTLGLMLLACGVGFCIGRIWAQEEAGWRAETALKQLLVQMENREILQQWEEPTGSPQLPLSQEQTALRAMEEILVDGIPYVGYLEIPSLELELPVIGQCSDELMKTAPCRYFGTVYQKNFVIGGHRYRRHFRKLYTLGYGDPVVFTTVTGERFQYQVEELEVIEPYEGEYLCSGDWDLSLFTCTTGGTSRLVVRCLSVEDDPL